MFEVPHRLSIIQYDDGRVIVNHKKIICEDDEKNINKKRRKRKRNIMRLIDNYDDDLDDSQDEEKKRENNEIQDGEELKFDQIVCGSNHSFVISLQENIVFGWGSNENNQLLLYHDNNNNKNVNNLNGNQLTLLPTRMGIIEKLMKCNKQVDIFVVGDATYLNVQHY